MKITDASKSGQARRVEKSTKIVAEQKAQSTAPAVETVLAGIPEHELTPRVREALMSLMAEVQQLRAEISAAKAQMAEIKRLADRDPLLDILNRRAFVRELERMLAMIERYGVKASLVFVDLNDLKRVNDVNGHPAGDAALAHVAAVLSANTRQTDIVGRLGGDEFGVILAQADKRTAEKKAQDLVELVRLTPAKWSGGELVTTISVGVAEIRDGVSAGEAMQHADAAMYEAKRRR